MRLDGNVVALQEAGQLLKIVAEFLVLGLVFQSPDPLEVTVADQLVACNRNNEKNFDFNRRNDKREIDKWHARASWLSAAAAAKSKCLINFDGSTSTARVEPQAVSRFPLVALTNIQGRGRDQRSSPFVRWRIN